MIERIDVTDEFLGCMDVLLEESHTRRDALIDLLGEAEYEERVERRHSTRAAALRGLLAREIFLTQSGRRVGWTLMNRWMSPPVVFAVAVIAMWWIGRSVAIGRYSFAHHAAIGIALVVLGVVIVGVSLRSFAVMGTTPNPTQPQKATELVTSGVYSLSRNPMYVGDAVILAGVAVWIGSVVSLVPLAAFVWFIDRFQIPVEEKALTELFGDRYTSYRSKVRRWL